MRKLQVSVGLVFLLFAAFVAWQAWGLRYYTRLGPGPGFFPLWLAGLLGLVSLGLIADAFRQPAAALLPAGFVPEAGGVVRILSVVAAILAAVFLLQPLGFRITMLLLYLFILLVMGQRNPIAIALIALGGSFGAFQLFHVLDVRLPVGMFGL